MTETLSLDGMRIGLCQQPCKPADPEYNGAYFEGCIEDAENDGLDILLGVEGMQGYLIGDQYEYHGFLREVDLMNENIRKATAGKQVAVAYGSLRTSWDRTGEDGRVTRHNGGYVFQNGALVSEGNKTLSPNYRMFPEARHFFSNRHLAEKIAFETGRPLRSILMELLPLSTLRRRNGSLYRLAQIFCEDGWPDDYAINPLLLISEHAEPGEEWVAVDHSASPWTWRKNNKRHRVIGGLIRKIPVERRPKLLAYVNRVGVEQSGKNFYVYDGSSAVYDSDGDLLFEVGPYEVGTKTFTFSSGCRKVVGHTPDDTKALYDAMGAAVDEFFGGMPEDRRFVYVGLSGGADSSVVAATLVSRPCLGPKRVIGVNMPYGDYNSPEGKDDAKTLAKRLSIKYRVRPITKIVDQIAKATGVKKGTLAHENIQARVRQEILAALAQKPGTVNGFKKRGGVFTANGNKVELAFGYGTLYADIAGAIALLADLVKREVYQLGEYLNRVVYGLEVIPWRIFQRPPTAELARRKQVDPFDYGTLDRRGYHDEWVRAVTEFRWDAERILKEYAGGTLEREFMLPEGHLRKLFPTAKSFVERLERDWKNFTGSYFKRIQCPPIIVFTRRAFGGDLVESLYSFLFTQAYRSLRKKVLSRPLRKKGRK